MDERMTITQSMAMNKDEQGAIIGTKGSLIGRIIRFKQGKKIIIGRDERKCDIVIIGGMVSRIHCFISYDANMEKYIVRDVSKNGVMADGTVLPPNEDNVLRKGSILLIGSADNEIILG